MPYNTRRKSLSLPSLGIHIPMTNAARAAAADASRSAGRNSTSSASTSSSSSSSSVVSPRSSASRSRSPDSHPSKRLKRSHEAASADPMAIEQTPPPSPTPATSVDSAATDIVPKKVDLEGINDDIVEGVITQLQSTANRPHLIRDLATVLGQTLSSVQQSANPCAIISSRLGSYMKRTCWSALAPCPLAKELEPVHPRRTYYFLTTFPRQPIPTSATAQQTSHVPDMTPSVSLTDDSGSDELDERRRQLSPSPELDLPRPDFFDAQDQDERIPASPIDIMPRYRPRNINDVPHDLPPLEKDEREFTQTADILQKRKFNQEPPSSEAAVGEYGFRDDLWLGENVAASFLTSPAIRPSIVGYSGAGRKEDEAESWAKLNKLVEWDQDTETIEVDDLDGLLEGC